MLKYQKLAKINKLTFQIIIIVVVVFVVVVIIITTVKIAWASVKN